MKIDLVKIYNNINSSYPARHSARQEEYAQRLKNIKNKNILNGFREMNDEYKYFSKEDQNITKLYSDCYETLGSFSQKILPPKLQFQYYTIYDQKTISSYVYKMIFLFSPSDGYSTELTLRNFQNYCNKFLGTAESIRYFLSDEFDAFMFPKSSSYGEFGYNVTDMKNALKTDVGPKILKNFLQISEIQKTCGGKLPTNKALFESKLLEVVYPLSGDNIDLVKLCAEYDVGGFRFKSMLHLMQNGVLQSTHTTQGMKLQTKQVDNLPDVNVEYLNEETGTKYHFVKLPSNDSRAMMLGEISGNCQTIGGGDADMFIIDGITRPNNGFYVLIKQGKKHQFDPKRIDWDNLETNGHEIVGQSYVWIGRDKKSLAIEAPQIIKDRCSNIEIAKIFEDFGQALDQQGYDRVIMGQHGSGLGGCKNLVISDGTRKNTYQRTASHTIPLEGQRYHFTTEAQYEIYSSERLANVRATLKELTKFLPNACDSESIISVEQGEALIDLLNKSLDQNEMNLICKYIASSYTTSNWNSENLKTLLCKLQDIEARDEKKFVLINSPKTKYWFNLGLTMEDTIDLPRSVIALLYSIDPYLMYDSIWSLIPLDELMTNIKTSTSIVNINKEALKLLDKYICGNKGDLSYMDSFSNELIAALISRIPPYDWAHRVMKLSDFANVSSDMAEWLLENRSWIIKVYSPFAETNVEKFIAKNDHCLEGMQREFLSCISKYCKLLDCELIKTLPDFAISILAKNVVLKAMYFDAKVELNKIFKQLDQNSDPLATKREIYSIINGPNDDYVSLTEKHLDVLLNLDSDGIKLNEICSIKKLSEHLPSKLKLLLSKPATDLYRSKIVTFEKLAAFELQEIQILLSATQYNYTGYVPELGIYANFDFISKKLCRDHYLEDFELALREQMYEINAEKMHNQLYHGDEYEF